MSVTRRPKLPCSPINRRKQILSTQQSSVAGQTQCAAVEMEVVRTEYRVKLQGQGGCGGVVWPGEAQQAVIAADHNEPPPVNSKTRRRFVL
jgi:hypothetical protein